LWLILAVLVGASLLGNVLLWGKLSGMQQHLAQGSVQAQSTAQEAKALAQTMAERAESNQAKLAILDARLQEMDALNRQVEAIVQQATRMQNSNLLTDLESGLRLASSQAQFTRNAQPLLDALAAAQTRLDQAGDTAVLLKPAASAIALDIQHLKTANYPDVNAAVDQLDDLVNSLDTLPLWVENQTHSPAPAASEHKTAPADKPRPLDKATGSAPQTTASATAHQASAETATWLRTLQAAGSSIWHEARSLVQVERMDGATPAAITRQEATLLREQMKLYALGARSAMLSGRLPAAAQTLAQLQQRLPQYFDRNSRDYRRVDTQLGAIRALLESGSSEAPQAQNSIHALALLNERLSAVPLHAKLPSSSAAAPATQKAQGWR
jgi:uroporphyrin-3 C-methyltransferase